MRLSTRTSSAESFGAVLEVRASPPALRRRRTSSGRAGRDRRSLTAEASAPRRHGWRAAPSDDWEQRGARAADAQSRYRAHEIHPPPARFGVELLEHAIRTTATEVAAPLPDELGAGAVRWGQEVDIRRLEGRARREVAGDLAKYATKSTEQAGGMVHRVSEHQIDALPVREHVRRYCAPGD